LFEFIRLICPQLYDPSATIIVSPPRAAVNAVFNVAKVFTVVFTANDEFAIKQNNMTKIDVEIFFILVDF
jgi:hypothetical protein